MTVAAAHPPRDASERTEHVLVLDKVTMQFGGLKAVSDLDLYIGRGELMGLIGPNGAGKTTVFNVITGVYRPTRGHIRFESMPIDGLKPHAIARRGITRTFQNIRLFGSRCCRDNVCVAAHQHTRASLLDAVLRTGRFEQDERVMKREADALLDTLGLSSWADTTASELPYGQQRRLEIARALAGKPRLLLLDEPAAGLNPQESDQLMHLIEHIRQQFHLTILLIEHDMRVVMGICQRIAVLDYGLKIAEGTPDQIRTNPKVIEAYLGEEVHADLGGGA
jgi:branched-chain amino acid transport system ATP-binding protein